MEIGNLQASEPGVRLRPSWWWYVVGGCLIAAAEAGTAVFLIHGVLGGDMDMQRVVVPGESPLTLSRPGSYTIFNEYQSVMVGTCYSNREDLAGLTCVLKESKTGRVVNLSPVDGRTSYSGGGRAGVGVFAFEISEPGEYVLTGTYTGPGARGPAVLAIAHEFGKKLLVLILGSMGISFGGGGLGIVIVLVTFFKRRKARRARQALEIPPVMPRG